MNEETECLSSQKSGDNAIHIKTNLIDCNEKISENAIGKNCIYSNEKTSGNEIDKNYICSNDKSLIDEANDNKNKQQTLDKEDNISVNNTICNDEKLMKNSTLNYDNAACENEIGKRVFEKENWQENVEEFFKAYPNAQNFADKIGQEIISNETLCTDEQCLTKAFLKVLIQDYISPQEIINDQKFRDNFVLNNEEIKTIIIDKYLESLEVNRPPKTITARGQIALTPTSKPRNINEAGEVINMMFKNRRI